MPRGNVAFVFPGQGSQTVGMGRDLQDRFVECRELFAIANRAVGFDLTRVFLDGPEHELRRTANAQPAILVVSFALYRVLGWEPNVVAGHSLGEYSALVAAGALSLEEAVALVHKRGRYMQEAVREGEGLMLAVLGVEADRVLEAIASTEGAVDIANYNSPAQIVIAGAPGPTREAAERCGARRIVELPVSAPFHCRLMEPAARRLAADLDATEFADLRIPLYTNVDARKITKALEARESLKLQVTRAVRWTDTIRRMRHDDAIDMFVEVGPGKVLSGLIQRIDPNTQRFAVSDASTIESVRSELREKVRASTGDTTE